MFRRFISSVVSLFILSFVTAAVNAPSAQAGNWPGWRGPTGIGMSDEQDLPLTWNAKSGENILWKVSTKGTTGHSCPIVWGDKLFLTTAGKQTNSDAMD